MNPNRIARLARRASLALAGAAVLYLIARFDMQSLPQDGCSPLFGVPPGAQLMIDRWAGAPEIGQSVLFESTPGQLHLGRVQPAPAGLTDEALVRLDAGELWIAVDDPACPGLDSRSLGPVSPDSVRGPIVIVF